MFSTINLHGQQFCGTDAILQRQMSNPDATTTQHDNGHHLSCTSADGSYNIPVVVHVLYNTPEGNISDEQVYDAIEKLNIDFLATDGVGFNTQIRFELANFDPDGNCTNGINRLEIASPYGNTEDADADLALKDNSRWPNSHYLNIWVVECIYLDISTCFPDAGYAFIPNFVTNTCVQPPFPFESIIAGQSGLDQVDGIVITNGVFGRIGTAFDTPIPSALAHEAGHWLSLYHTFAPANMFIDETCTNGSSQILSVNKNSSAQVHVVVESLDPISLAITDNHDFGFLDFGVKAKDLNFFPWFSNYQIDDNVFRADDLSGFDRRVHAIQIDNKNLSQNYSTPRSITRNQIIISDNENGMSIRNDGDWDIIDNKIEFSVSAGFDNFADVGIRLQNYHNNYLKINKVIELPSNLNTTTAFSISSSGGNVYCCNTTKGNKEAYSFEGYCASSELRHNDFSTHNLALWVMGDATQGFSVIGNQPYQIPGQPMTNSNVFNAGSGTARIDGDDDNISESQFFVKDLNTPNAPVSIVAPAAIDVPWFEDVPSENMDCASDPRCLAGGVPPPKKINSTDIEVAKNVFGNSKAGAALQWEGARDIYSRMKADHELIGQSAIVDVFYSQLDAGSTIKKYYEADVAVQSVQDMPSEWGLILKSALDKIATVEEIANAALQGLAFSRTREDSLQVYWSSQDTKSKIRGQMITVLQIQHQMDSLRRIKAFNALELVRSLPEENILQKNRKESLLVYLEITVSGAKHLNEIQFAKIKGIAHQCVLSGGSAVLLARSLYQLNEDEGFEEFDICGMAEERAQSEARYLGGTVMVRPNPSTGLLQIQIPSHGNELPVNIRFVDVSGNIVLQGAYSTSPEGEINVNASQLPNGIYFCHTNTEKLSFPCARVVITH